MRVPCALLAATVLAGAATSAEAGVVVGDGVPFSAGELEHALAARAPGATRIALDVRTVAPGLLLVVGARARWQVMVGDARGALAARLVALNVVAAIDDAPGAIDAALAPAPGRARRWSVSALAGVRRGVGDRDLTSATGAVEVEAGARWWLAGALEWAEDVRAAPPGAAPVDGRSWLARGLAGARAGAFELAAGPLVGRIAIDSGEHARGWQVGVGAIARARWSIADRWALVAGVGVDGYRRRIEVQRDGALVAATPRVAIAATVGLRWEPGR